MIGPDLPEIPLPLKNIQQYLKIASQHDQRDPVVGYWCRVYAFQTGFKLSTKTAKETNFLMELMDWLEKTKKNLHDNEAITNDVAAQAHLENWALKLFLYADKNDRAANFEKNVVKSFFTAGLLYDVLTVFGELTEEAIQNRKYAKWKAAYIHNCLKNGETPIPGPMQEGNENDNLDKNMEEDSLITEAKEDDTLNADELIGTRNTNPSDVVHGTTIKDSIDKWSSGNKDCKTLMETEGILKESNSTKLYGTLHDFACQPCTGVMLIFFVSFQFWYIYVLLNQIPILCYYIFAFVNCTYLTGGVELSVEQIGKAQKFIKWAGSALNYDDVPTTVLNLRKALHLLTTGQELE